LETVITIHTAAGTVKRISFYFLFSFIAFGGIHPVFALDPYKTINQYGHNAWMRKNGLPANTVNVALQTHDGYFWIGTSAGLFRFDGVHYSEVNTNPNDSVANEKISSLCETRDGILWIGTTYGGLRCLKDGKVTLYGQNEGLAEIEIKRLFESRTGNFWVGTAFGLFLLSEGRFKQVPINPAYITSITEDSQGRIWVGTHAGVRILKDVDGSEIFDLTSANGLPNNITSSICVDRTSNVWIGTEDGLACWKNGLLKTYKTNTGLSNNHITTIYEDNDGNLWVGTRNGLNRFYQNKWSRFTESDGLSNNFISSFVEDHEGSLWVCTLEGLNQFRDVNITPYTTKEGLANDYISSVVETPDRSMYFLSNSDISITRLRNGIITKFYNQVGPAFVSRDSSIWIGQNGLLFNLKNNRITTFDTTTGLPAKWISAITEDEKSLIIYIDNIGIRRFANGRLKPYLMNDGLQYPNIEYIVCLYTQSDGTLWAGLTHGLVRIHDGKSTTFTKNDGLAGNWTSSISDDGHGNIWITSPQGGFARYRDGKFTTYTNKVGLFTNEIYCAIFDDTGDIWLSSPRGIGHIKHQELDDFADGRLNAIHSDVFLMVDGMKTDECFGEWQPNSWKTHDGHLWFPTKKGAVMIDPKAIKKNTLSPPVIIEQIIVNRQTKPYSQFATLAPGSKSLEIHYSALSFLVPERVLFKYKLEGYDTDWIDAGTRRAAYYTNLAPGNYHFRVIACNNDGLWNEAGASYGFTLEPYFYQTHWFFIILGLVVVGIVYGFFRLRLWQHVKKEKELQERIREALANIKVLSGLIPICANCKKIRDDKGYWDQLEEYIGAHSDATFSHGICPDCASELFPGIATKNITQSTDEEK
jgi:ligand-binding sensor domain-containing protein